MCSLAAKVARKVWMQWTGKGSDEWEALDSATQVPMIEAADLVLRQAELESDHITILQKLETIQKQIDTLPRTDSDLRGWYS